MSNKKQSSNGSLAKSNSSNRKTTLNNTKLSKTKKPIIKVKSKNEQLVKLEELKKILAPIRLQDPELSDEINRYAIPLPSRNYICQILSDSGKPLSINELSEKLAILPDEQSSFIRRLEAMQREGTLLQNRKNCFILPERANLIAGKIEGHPDGYGFVLRDDHEADIFLDSRQMAKVMHGDRVLVRITGQDRRGRNEGAIVEVSERVNLKLVGRVFIEHGLTVVEAENRKINQRILIPPKNRFKVEAGQIVEVQIIEQPTNHRQPIGKISKVLGNYADDGMEIEIALRKHDLPFEFSSSIIKSCEKLSENLSEKDLLNRQDLRHLPFVTIDGETARDFDDAVFCQPIENSKTTSRSKNSKITVKENDTQYKLYVAIADVSHYVKDGSKLDYEAYARGNSVYFPRRVIPMLPEKLSNGLCSLNPLVDRLAMVCEMNVSLTGEVTNYKFYPAVFQSKARLTYTEVANCLQGNLDGQAETVLSLLPQLKDLQTLFYILQQSRQKRGAIDFESHETTFEFDTNGKIAAIKPVIRNQAHRIIEECMLAANVCAADFINVNQHSGLFRVHLGPTPERLENLQKFLNEFALQLKGGDSPQAKDYADLLQQAKNLPQSSLLQTVMLRSMQQAVYTPDNLGHFGLAYPAYTHFTSPIRRYPDLLVHRTIKAILNKKQYQPATSWEEMGQHCSQTERRADEATRDVINWLKCFYMIDRIGEVFSGLVTGVTPFGVFVALDQLYVEGMIHVTDLGDDYFHYDKIKHQLLGEHGNKSFRLGDALTVQVARVDPERRRIDFVLIGQQESEKNIKTSKPAKTSKVNKFTNTSKSTKSKASKEIKATNNSKYTKQKTTKIANTRKSTKSNEKSLDVKSAKITKNIKNNRQEIAKKVEKAAKFGKVNKSGR